MAIIKWRDEFNTGHPQMDADHQRLAAMINTIHDAWSAGKELGSLGPLFEQLVTYTNDHFVREEQILESLGYERLSEQKAEHELLRRMALKFRQDYLEGDDPAPFTPETREFLRTWLMGHILEEDMKYKHLFTAQ